jgi:hypothetical protein
MMRSLLATAAASLLSGCAAVAYGDGAPVVDRPFQTDAALGERTLATSTSGSYIYVSNQNGPLPPRVGSILVYLAGSNGDVAPCTSPTAVRATTVPRERRAWRSSRRGVTAMPLRSG